MEKEITRRADNGVTVHAYRNPALHGFYISLFLRAGSMYESPSENGMTHFLEHALIRNVNCLMNGELYALLDRKGLEFNASTYNEMVQFYLSGASEKFSVGVDIISKLFSPLALSESDFLAEKDRIKAEIRESDDKTSLSAFASKIIYEGTSLSQPILGTLGGISKITKRGLEEYRKRIFTSENIFFYLTGNFTEEDIEGLISTVGKISLPTGEKKENLAQIPEKFGNRESTAHIKNADFTLVRFNFDMDMSELSGGAVDLLYDVLLGGYNSGLFIEMSEKKGLFYDLNGSVEKYKNIGCFSFSFEVKGGSVYEAIESTVEILVGMKNELLSEDRCMKAGYVDNGMLLYDDNRELNFTFAYDCHIMDAKYASIEERAAYYAGITAEDIRSAARKIFEERNLTLALKGNKRKIDTERIEALVKALDN